MLWSCCVFRDDLAGCLSTVNNLFNRLVLYLHVPLLIINWWASDVHKIILFTSSIQNSRSTNSFDYLALVRDRSQNGGWLRPLSLSAATERVWHPHPILFSVRHVKLLNMQSRTSWLNKRVSKYMFCLCLDVRRSLVIYSGSRCASTSAPEQIAPLCVFLFEQWGVTDSHRPCWQCLVIFHGFVVDAVHMLVQ